jgi:hypothetical protein
VTLGDAADGVVDDVKALREQLARTRAERMRIERGLTTSATLQAAIDAARRDADALTSPALRAQRKTAGALRGKLRTGWALADRQRHTTDRIAAAARNPFLPLAALAPRIGEFDALLTREADHRSQLRARLEAAGVTWFAVPEPADPHREDGS